MADVCVCVDRRDVMVVGGRDVDGVRGRWMERAERGIGRVILGDGLHWVIGF